MGERAHLARPDTDLEVHVTDVVNLLRYEDLHDVVLVGHSYAGNVVTAAADRMTDRVAQLVYVDTGPLPDGVAQVEFNPPEERERNAAAVAEHGDGWQRPPPPWAELAAGVPGVDDSILTLLRKRSVPQPWATATMPVCRHMADDSWRYQELPTWHWPMFGWTAARTAGCPPPAARSPGWVEERLRSRPRSSQRATTAVTAPDRPRKAP
jgi:pimeloyl-ACP methyl ester carboxylesterase